ncbi:hypothetical protein ACSNOH_31755 [Streptomyces sp. URMC 127]|uniref:hypothetical protein n=1 Tax=Streptomyces sp. URMC 127 TaxID=3423402 RepID=UPI003F1BE50A
MHMNSAPHLLAEDRPEFERVLDQALRTANHDPELAAAIGQRLNTEQLRDMALESMSAITACAAVEYQNYVRARDALRALSATERPRSPDDEGAPDEESASPGAAAPAAPDGEPEESSGAGAGAVLAVLAPVLAGIAALIFLAIGYVLRSVGSDSAVADPMVNVGWWFAGLTAAGAFIAMVGIVLTALRNGSSEGSDARGVHIREDTDRAREAWRQALIHRGLLPFVRDALANAPGEAEPKPGSGPGRPGSGAGHSASFVPRRREGSGRTPQLGYSRPGFTSPDGESSSGGRAGYTSPDFTGPEYGSPDRRPE